DAAAIEHHAFLRQTGEIRRFDRVHAITGQRTEALLIGHDDENVRPTGGGSSGRRLRRRLRGAESGGQPSTQESLPRKTGKGAAVERRFFSHYESLFPFDSC